MTIQDRDDRIAMWCDLLLANIHAQTACFDVTRRAEIYMRAAGLPFERVLDALAIDEETWQARVAALRVNEATNRAASRRHRDDSEP